LLTWQVKVVKQPELVTSPLADVSPSKAAHQRRTLHPEVASADVVFDVAADERGVVR
jgi:hypothetical protein